MSQQLVNQYRSDIDRLRKISGLSNEQIIRPAFRRLLDTWASNQKLVFIEEFPYLTPHKTTVYPDGTVLHDIRVPLGYWEAKDTRDDLDEEIRKKFAKGYPQDNIVFENSETAVLAQNRQEVMRASMTDAESLSRLVTLFFSYERPEIAEFRKAVEQFKADLPAVLSALRASIDRAYAEAGSFSDAAARFLTTCKETINPTLGEADVREMLIQHILTEEIFANVFNDSEFHRKNNIARELYALEERFFTGAVKKETLRGLEPYYAAIRANAAQITSHTEKQTFLKVIYENFYKVYDAKKADRLGVVYTPNEIVKFMIQGADWLCEQHFKRNLIDQHVEILDPATGTGTFVCELLDYFRGDPRKLVHKYKNELHANEVAILPYYVANLNIEATYAAISGQFAEYPNLCFVDTLDNVAGLGIRAGHQHDMFAALSDENIERVRRQNARKISVIIGNPPYNANQQNENDNNKNRTYPRIDELIKSSYIRLSNAQKTKLYDMYARFFRWASDRLHDDGVLAFVTNRSFIDKATYDGFRKAIRREFDIGYVYDLGGDWKALDDAGGGNVFGIGTGVAISFWLKKNHRQPRNCKIYLKRLPRSLSGREKLFEIQKSKLSDRDFNLIGNDGSADWITVPKNEDWATSIPIVSRDRKVRKRGADQAIFERYMLGISTNRDEWLYDMSPETLKRKVRLLRDVYDRSGRDFDLTIKWSETLKRRRKANYSEEITDDRFISVEYRPFVAKLHYKSQLFVDRPGISDMYEPLKEANRYICFSDRNFRDNFCVLATRRPADLHFGASKDGFQCIPETVYDRHGKDIGNIRDVTLRHFRESLKLKDVTKEDIFHYVYAVLHDPIYRDTYAQNLKREFPRIPLHPDFRQWADWGKRLMTLHLDYESVAAWPLLRSDMPDEKARAAGVAPKTILKADVAGGTIRIDGETSLSGIPSEAFTYRLGNRSGIEWILDQYKEKTPRDPTIREKFNTYRFADYKEKMIELIARVTRVSVETMEVVDAMQRLTR